MALLKDCWNKRWPHDGRKVFEIIAEIKVRETVSAMDGEVHTVGHHIERRSFHVIATDDASARLAWWQRYHRDGENRIVTCDIIASVDAEIETRTR